MRILTIVRELGPGGTQRAAQTRSISYRDRGHDVAVLSTDMSGPREENIRKAGLEVWIGGSTPDEREAAIQQALAWKPDVVHMHRTGRPERKYTQVLRRLKEAASGRLPALEVNHFGRIDYSDDRHLFDVHLQLSRWCLWKFYQWSRGLDPQPLGVVAPHLIASAAFHPAGPDAGRAFRVEHGIAEDAIVFGRVGQPYEAKWHPIIFDAFVPVARRHPKAYLVIVGAPESYADRIAQLPADVRDRVVQPPFLHGDDKLRACYAAMDVFLHAAYIGESFGQVLGESLLCHVPIISLSTPAKDNSQLEVVGHERGGLIVNDCASMIEAMERLIDDAPLRQRFAEQGCAYTKEHFDVPPLTDHLLEITRHVIEHEDRAKLRQALDDAGIITRVSWPDLRALMADSMGRVPLRERIKMHLVHMPWLYRRRMAKLVGDDD
jgi:glycosyltransferase involved in cell wall biosynthesis